MAVWKSGMQSTSCLFWKLWENFQKDVDPVPLLESSMKKRTGKARKFQLATEHCCTETEKLNLTALRRSRPFTKRCKVLFKGMCTWEAAGYYPLQAEEDHRNNTSCVGGPSQYALIKERRVYLILILLFERKNKTLMENVFLNLMKSTSLIALMLRYLPTV